MAGDSRVWRGPWRKGSLLLTIALVIVAVPRWQASEPLVMGHRPREKVSIKINEGTVRRNTWHPPAHNNWAWSAPRLNRQPHAFSGPENWRALKETCLTVVDSEYEWTLCPFHNVTQRDKNKGYGSLNVVAGVWDKYEIKDGKYSAMLFTDGTDCASGVKRSTRVELICVHSGTANSIRDIVEPSACTYGMKFKSPLFCADGLTVSSPVGATGGAISEGAQTTGGIGRGRTDLDWSSSSSAAALPGATRSTVEGPVHIPPCTTVALCRDLVSRLAMCVGELLGGSAATEGACTEFTDTNLPAVYAVESGKVAHPSSKRKTMASHKVSHSPKEAPRGVKTAKDPKGASVQKRRQTRRRAKEAAMETVAEEESKEEEGDKEYDPEEGVQAVEEADDSETEEANDEADKKDSLQLGDDEDDAAVA